MRTLKLYLIRIYFFIMILGMTLIRDRYVCNANDIIADGKEVIEVDLGDYSSEMSIGDTQLLNASIISGDAAANKLEYKSSDTSVATVNGIGRITAKGEGSTYISVICGKTVEQFELNVKSKANNIVKDIEVGNVSNSMYVGKTQTINATVVPNNASDGAVMYSSSNPEVAKVSSGGEITAISVGDVIINVSAGSYVKEIPISVKVQTTDIRLDNNYIVLKQGESYSIKGYALPNNAEQQLLYSSVNSKVASVSASGIVSAQNIGSTSILVSNGDYMASVTVIVNKGIDKSEDLILREEYETNNHITTNNISVNDFAVINSDLLYSIYDKKQVINIQGNGYIITLDGSKIKNFDNELSTNVKINKEKALTTFIINEGKPLCGELSIKFDNDYGKYIYIYNESKNKYERLDISTNGCIVITSAGKYAITNSKLGFEWEWLWYTLVASLVIVVIISVVYIATRKKYWFW